MKETQAGNEICTHTIAVEVSTNEPTTVISPAKILTHFDALVNPPPVIETGKADPLVDYEHLRITAEKEYPNNEPLITWDGFGVASAGNLTGISAPSKAGKSAFAGVLLAGSISTNGIIDGFENINVEPNTEGKAVIHFDTEQSEIDQQYNVRTVLKRAGMDKTPEHFLSYNIRQLPLSDYKKVTDALCLAAAKKFFGIYAIVIDGFADYVMSVNDEETATEIIQYFTLLAIQYQCPVIGLLHTNPDGSKERGHLGSQLQRKCYALITISKSDDDISVAMPKFLRKGGNNDLQSIYYKYSHERGLHLQIDTPDNGAKRDAIIRQQHCTIAKEIFAPTVALKYSEAVEAIMQHTSKGERTAKTMISNMKGWGIIKLHDDKRFRINAD